MRIRDAILWWAVSCVLALLAVWCPPVYAEGLPPRPSQAAAEVEAAIAAGQCVEQAARPGHVLDCEGVVLPLVVWSHLEELADDSRTVRAIYDVRMTAAEKRIADLEQHLELERAPVPVMQRPGVRIGLSMAGGAAAVLAGGWALSFVGGA